MSLRSSLRPAKLETLLQIGRSNARTRAGIGSAAEGEAVGDGKGTVAELGEEARSIAEADLRGAEKSSEKNRVQ